MKKILGLDLGVSSIGWALIEENTDQSNKIIGMGSRIIPLATDDKEEFTRGNSISKNQKRTLKRTQRKGYDRNQMRRANLICALKEKRMLPPIEMISMEKLTLWKLRSDAASKEISLNELGRVLLHLNQKRGYKSSRKEENINKKETDYVAEVKTRHENLQELKLTIGQYFYNELLNEPQFEIKRKVYPREAYIEEFNRIIEIQKAFHPELNEEFIRRLKEEIIYYQRNLKSQKGLVSICEFEGFYKETNSSKGKKLFIGPKVAPRSSPIAQICKIWETINNLKLQNKKGETLSINIETKKQIFDYLDNHDKISQAELFKILNLKREDGWYGNKQIAKGLQGNLTKSKILACFNTPEEFEQPLKFETTIIQSEDEVYRYDKRTGEVIDHNNKKSVSPEIEKQPLYILWHLIYATTDKENCINLLVDNFKVPIESAQKLASLDFTNAGFSNKSVKAMRKILPYLMEGYDYSDSCMFAGYNHSGSITNEENLKRILIEKIPNLSKNSLRQPIVEKILNQMINVVNAILEKYGRPDEIRVELARELKQSRDERNDTYTNISKTERENQSIAKRLEEYHIRATRNNIIKWRLFSEIDGEESKANACCIYCGKPFGLTAALNGTEVDIEHIIPKARLFDDSQSNKTLSHRKCNAEKGDMTAYDYMRKKSDAEFNDYLERIESLYKKGALRKSKRDKLLMPAEKIPQDFIARQLRETQYISRKAREILSQVCTNAWATSGSVTAYLRRIWGWDDVLMNLHLPKFRELGLTEMIEIGSNGRTQKKEIIIGWSKRDDHRHHAIDALTIACTKQGFVQRINTLNSEKTRKSMYDEIAKERYDSKKNLLENYIFDKKPFTTKQVENVAADVIVSFKPGKRVATLSKYKAKGKNQQCGVIVPRGPLSEGHVYGKIRVTEHKPIKFMFENPNLIAKQRIKSLVLEKLSHFDDDPKKALSSMKKEPIYLDADKTIELSYGSCYLEEFVMKYPINDLNAKHIESVVDKQVKAVLKERLAKHNNNEKEAFKDLENNPIWINKEKNIIIKTVRLFTGLKSAEPVKKNKNGEDIGFVKPGNNHHIAIYIDESGNYFEHVCTFWHAVERKKYGFPVIINASKDIWNQIFEKAEGTFPDSFTSKLPPDNCTLHLSMQQNEMFVLGVSNEDYNNYRVLNEFSKLNEQIYKVQNLSERTYRFCQHNDTSYDISKANKPDGRYYNIRSIDALKKLNPIKISCNIIGEIKEHQK